MSPRAVLVSLAVLSLNALASRAAAAEVAPDPAPGLELTGSVRAADGTPLPQLMLLLHGPSGSRRILTGPEGRFRARGLPPGDYTVAVDAPGFVVSPEARTTLSTDSAPLDLTLAPAPVREHVLVAATRGEAVQGTLGISTSVVDRERIDEREAAMLLPLLEELPGLSVARTGGVGRQASAFVRGGESRYVRVVVDGVPVNQPGGPFDFGHAVPLELERIELVRGAASSLYGTDALAGVLHLVTRQAGLEDGARVRGEAEAGRFAWRRAQGATWGRRGRFDWNVGLQRLDTDNQGPNAFFEQTAVATALGLASEPITARLTLRLEDGQVGTPGQTAFGRPDLDAFFERRDLAAGLTLRHGRGRSLHELRAGLARTEQRSMNPQDSGPFLATWQGRTAPFAIPDFPDPLGFQNDSERLSLGYRLELQAGSRHLLTGGIDLEHETGVLGAGAEERLRPQRTNVGAYVQDRVVVGERAYLTLGARVERNGSFGTRAVPRAALAVRLRGGEDATLVRASAGAGIKEPDFFQSFGASMFARGNPDLRPERSRTYDLGLEQRLFGGRLRAEATVYHHDYLDQIAFTVVDFETFAGTFVNLARTRARGLELAAEAAPLPLLRLRAQYTLTDGEIVVSPSGFDPVYEAGRALLRRPRHQGSFTVSVGGERASGGATLVAVGRRADSDFAGLGLLENEGYTRIDARARVRLHGRLEAFVAAENVLDREYQEALGYPALGRAVRAGLRWRSSAER